MSKLYEYHYKFKQNTNTFDDSNLIDYDVWYQDKLNQLSELDLEIFNLTYKINEDLNKLVTKRNAIMNLINNNNKN